MNRVASCKMSPHACAVFPTLGANHARGYWDTGVDVQGPGIHIHRMYISVEAVDHLARQQGWVAQDDHATLLAELERAREESFRLAEELDRAEAVIDSIDVIESAEFKARRKSGRIKKEPVTA